MAPLFIYPFLITHPNSHQGETQATPCLSPPCPSATARARPGCDRATGLVFPCLCTGMAQGAPAAQLNAGQKRFCHGEASLLASSKLISSVDGKLQYLEKGLHPSKDLEGRSLFSGNYGVQRDCGLVTHWVMACKIHLSHQGLPRAALDHLQSLEQGKKHLNFQSWKHLFCKKQMHRS